MNKENITSIAIGGFDGMHIAHQTLFSNLNTNGAIVSIESGFANLTPKKNREKYTIYPIYYYELEEIKGLDGIDFIKLLQKEFPNLNKIVVGFDFCFGKNRAYCINELKKVFSGEVVVINEICVNDIAVHSRVIRDYLVQGDLKTANTLLGREYEIEGLHIKGQGLGNKEFVPTINLKVDDYLLPCEGVYVTKTYVSNKEYNSVTFLGHRVTTDGSYAVETHILDKEVLVENETITVKFFKRLRGNKKFDSFEALKKQIKKDIGLSKNFFNI